MEESYDNLIHILEKSVKKNGSIPLTTGHLLNILKMIEDRREGNLCDATEWDIY